MEGDGRSGTCGIAASCISIHSLRMEGDNKNIKQTLQIRISIHSLRMEGDSGVVVAVVGFGISIHSLRMEGDQFR